MRIKGIDIDIGRSVKAIDYLCEEFFLGSIVIAVGLQAPAVIFIPAVIKVDIDASAFFIVKVYCSSD